MSYASIDAQIQDWTRLHALKLFTSNGEREIRCVYVSSVSGECFQIRINPPEAGQVCVYAACIEGRRQDDDDEIWRRLSAFLLRCLTEAYSSQLRYRDEAE